MRPFALATLLPQIPAHAARCPSSREGPARSLVAASRHPSPNPALAPSRRSNGASPLPSFRNRGPELPVKNLSVRFHEKTRFGHLLFVRAENFPEILDLLIHPVQHLPNGVYLNFTFFVTFQREANCEVFGQANEHRLVRHRSG